MPLRKQASSRHSCPWSQSNASIGIDWLLPKIRVCNPHKKSLIAFASKNKITPRVRQSNRKERTLRARLGDRCLRFPHHGKPCRGPQSSEETSLNEVAMQLEALRSSSLGVLCARRGTPRTRAPHLLLVMSTGHFSVRLNRFIHHGKPCRGPQDGNSFPFYKR